MNSSEQGTRAAYPDYRLWVPMAVRWADMDAFGHVNNAVYSTYLESARMKYFEAIRLDDHRDGGILGPAVVSATVNFREQVRYPANLDAGVRVSRLGNSSFTIEHHLLRTDDNVLVADGTTIVAWVDYSKPRAMPLPEGLKASIRRFEGRKEL